MLENKGYKVQIYCMAGKKELINDKILKKYDAIISIGKTVQYAMSLQIPMYVYDIHGGEGYLTLENIEKNRAKNFSGRGFDKKSAEQICNEIIEEFEKALKITPEIKKYAYDNFCFENKIDEILEIINKKENVNLKSIREKYENDKREVLLTRGMANYLIEKYEDILRIEKHKLYTEIKRLTKVEEELRKAIIEKDKLIKDQEDLMKIQETYITNVENSIYGKCKRVIKRITNRKEKS